MKAIITVAYMFISFFSFSGFVEGDAVYIAPLQTATVCEIMEETVDKEYAPHHTDHYNADCDRWEEDDGSPIPDDIIDMGDRCDWEIEHGTITDAREQYCIECHAWAKYHYCPICEKKIW